MIIPALIGLIPMLVNTVEKIVTKPQSGDAKKELVMSILASLYDKFLVDKIPDFPGIDEKKIFLELSSSVIDLAVKKLSNKGDVAA